MENNRDHLGKSVIQRLSRAVAQKIPKCHATDWPEAVAKAWIDRTSKLHPILGEIRSWAEGLPRTRPIDTRALEWIIWCIPGSLLVASLLPENKPSSAARQALMEDLSRIDALLDHLANDGRKLRQAVSDEDLRKRSGCGGTPIGIMACRMGRPGLLVGNKIHMTQEERKTLITTMGQMGLVSAAIDLFMEAPEDEKTGLSDAVWRCIHGDKLPARLPDCDPPALWWDRSIKQYHTKEYPPHLGELVRRQPHLSADLAAAMLRAGIRQVQALAQAQPGLGMASMWPGRDGNLMPATGVVVDSWIASLTGRWPGSHEKTDLVDKLDLIMSRLPREEGQRDSSRQWLLVGQWLAADAVDEPGAERATESPRQSSEHQDNAANLVDALLSIVGPDPEKMPSSFWRRWLEAAAFSVGHLSLAEGLTFQSYLHQLLPFVRQSFLSFYLTASERPEQKQAEDLIEHMLSLPYRMEWPAERHKATDMEWEIWTLFRDRSARTCGGRKSQEATSLNLRTQRQILRMAELACQPTWPLVVVEALHSFFLLDEETPPWLLAFLEKETLRLSNRGGGAQQERGRSRL